MGGGNKLHVTLLRDSVAKEMQLESVTLLGTCVIKLLTCGIIHDYNFKYTIFFFTNKIRFYVFEFSIFVALHAFLERCF